MVNLEHIKEVKSVSCSRGISTLGTLILLFILVSCVFSAFQIIPFYYSFYEIQGLMQAQADKAQVINDTEMRRTLSREMKKLNIPADPEEDLKINRYSGKIVLELSYEEVFFVDFGGGYDFDIWTFKFNPRGEAKL
ncbi:MAG TPA: DUF4845 domain-containing protein [Oligoflexia bacterium]|nr:DUF4845 domain-containing protein [Oligoflexia bacterium]HMP49297.1 DUF4845 domain-containing protein [Oligoflexia bacterium]